MPTRDLTLVLKARDEATRALKSLDRNIGGLQKAVIGLGIAFSGLKLAQFASSLALTAARTETLGIVVKQVGKIGGYTAEEIDNYEDSIKRLGITTQATRQILTRLIQNQVDLTHATKLARIAQDAAVIGGINSSEAFERMIHGITSLNVRVLRNIGIIVDLQHAYSRFAKEQGITIQDITSQQKQQIALNEVLEQGEKIYGTYEAAMETAGKQLTSLLRYIEEAKNALGQALLPVLSEIIKAFTLFLKALQTEEVIAAMKAIGEAIRTAVDRKIQALAKTLADLIVGIATWIAKSETVLQVLSDMVTGLTRLADWLLCNKTALLAVGAAITGIMAIIAPIPMAIAAISAAVVYLAGRWEMVKKYAVLAWLYIKDFLATTWDKLATQFETFINGIIWGLNKIIQGINLIKPGADIELISEVQLKRIAQVTEQEWAAARAIGYVADETKLSATAFEDAAEKYHIADQAIQHGASAIEEQTEALAEQADTVKEVTYSYGPYIEHLVTMHPAVHKLNQEYAVLEAELITQEGALRANQYAIRDAQAEYQRMQGAISGLNQQLSEAKQRLQQLSAPKLKGMRDLEEQIFAIEQQIKRVKFAELLGKPLEAVFPELNVALPRTTESLQRMLEVLELQKGLRYDEALKKIKEAAEGVPEEMTYEQAIKSIRETKAEIGHLTNAIAYETEALEAQAEHIKSLQYASEQLNAAIAQTELRMRETEKQLDKVTEALTIVLEWILKDRQEFIKMGSEAKNQAYIVDETVRALWDALEGFISGSVDASIGNINALLSEYERAKALLQAGLPTYGWPTLPPAEVVPSAQVGGYVARGGLVSVHPGEQILKAGAGATHIFNITYSPTFSTATESEARDFMQIIAKYIREEGRRTTWRIP